jgi:hypothetical protein
VIGNNGSNAIRKQKGKTIKSFNWVNINAGQSLGNTGQETKIPTSTLFDLGEKNDWRSVGKKGSTGRRRKIIGRECALLEMMKRAKKSFARKECMSQWRNQLI